MQGVIISVVIPVYNSVCYLQQCLDSLSNQTFPHFELICVDDGSSDTSLEFLKEYQKKEPRLQVYQNTEQSDGAALARNLGLRKATGEYVLVLDSDDYVSENLLERVYHKAKETNADVVIFDANQFHSETGEILPCNQYLSPTLLPHSSCFLPEEVADDLFLLGSGVAWNKLIRRSLVEENGLSFFPVAVLDDMNFTFSVLMLASSIAVVGEKLLFYRIFNKNSQMANLDRDPLSPVKMLMELRTFMEEKGVFERYGQAYEKCAVGVFQWYFDRLKEKKALYEALHRGELNELGLSSGVELGKHRQDLTFLEEIERYTFDEYLEEKKQECLIQQGKSYAIFGLGVRTDLVYEKIVSCGAEVSCVVDSALEKQGQIFRGIAVESPDVLKGRAIFAVCVTSRNYFEEMKAGLMEMGFGEEEVLMI